MSANPWHRRYHSDALAGMISLTLEERGAYQTVLDLIYDRGGPIADNERLLAGYMNCSIRKWRSLRASLVAAGKLTVDDDIIGAPDFDAANLVTERQPLAKAVRILVLERDGSTCRYCGGTDGPFEIDHIFPVARGGLDDLDNLTVACRPCNRSKGSLLVEEWLQ